MEMEKVGLLVDSDGQGNLFIKCEQEQECTSRSHYERGSFTSSHVNVHTKAVTPHLVEERGTESIPSGCLTTAPPLIGA
jgi:hypothetical protein